MHDKAAEILEFWQGVGPAGWYTVSPELDAEIRDRFEGLWRDVCEGAHKDWQLHADEALALIILLDQFPRNMFRDSGESFASDKIALCIAKKAIRHNFDQQIEPPMRSFFYLPFMHSESPVDQDESVRAFKTRMPAGGNMLHARAHRQVIRDFGRFPYRNAALGRSSTADEIAYLDAGGYGYTVKRMSE